jgi:hypothetical protein
MSVLAVPRSIAKCVDKPVKNAPMLLSRPIARHPLLRV